VSFWCLQWCEVGINELRYYRCSTNFQILADNLRKNLPDYSNGRKLALNPLSSVFIFLALATFADGLGYPSNALMRFVGVVRLAAAV